MSTRKSIWEIEIDKKPPMRFPALEAHGIDLELNAELDLPTAMNIESFTTKVMVEIFPRENEIDFPYPKGTEPYIIDADLVQLCCVIYCMQTKIDNYPIFEIIHCSKILSEAFVDVLIFAKEVSENSPLVRKGLALQQTAPKSSKGTQKKSSTKT